MVAAKLKRNPHSMSFINDLREAIYHPKRQDFTSRLEYAKACYAAGVLPESRNRVADDIKAELLHWASTFDPWAKEKA
jgi:hypothetical protein